MMRKSMEEALSRPLEAEGSKGFALMAKMGYTPGMSLGKSGEGRKEPVPLQLKPERTGLGLEKRVKEQKTESEVAAAKINLEIVSKIKEIEEASNTRVDWGSVVDKWLSQKEHGNNNNNNGSPGANTSKKAVSVELESAVEKRAAKRTLESYLDTIIADSWTNPTVHFWAAQQVVAARNEESETYLRFLEEVHRNYSLAAKLLCLMRSDLMDMLPTEAKQPLSELSSEPDCSQGTAHELKISESDDEGEEAKGGEPGLEGIRSFDGTKKAVLYAELKSVLSSAGDAWKSEAVRCMEAKTNQFKELRKRAEERCERGEIRAEVNAAFRNHYYDALQLLSDIEVKDMLCFVAQHLQLFTTLSARAQSILRQLLRQMGVDVEVPPEDAPEEDAMDISDGEEEAPSYSAPPGMESERRRESDEEELLKLFRLLAEDGSGGGDMSSRLQTMLARMEEEGNPALRLMMYELAKMTANQQAQHFNSAQSVQEGSERGFAIRYNGGL